MHFYIILLVVLLLIIFGSLSAYSYWDIKEETDNSLYAKNISLANLITCFLFTIIISLLLYMKYLSQERLTIISIFILAVVAILFTLIYYFLEEEKKDKDGYSQAKRELDNNSNLYNKDLITINFVLTILAFFFLAIITTYTAAIKINEKKDQNIYLSRNTITIEDTNNFIGDDRIKKVLIL